jgi:60 kDa SS-A/Ro ribonucleoprotein
VLACLLFEDTFYEDGESVADRIARAAADPRISPFELAELAVEARVRHNLRHVPLLLASILADRAKGNSIVPDTIGRVIQRADEIAEFLAIRCKVKGVGTGELVKPGVITHGIRKGLARAFAKFDAYQLAKYEGARDAIKLRDVLRLVRPAPVDDRQAALWGDLRHGTLARPDTWESALAGGADKKAVFTRLLEDGKLGYLALLRNLRGMRDAGVDRDLVRQAILARRGGADKVFPFRFIAAAKAAPEFEPELDQAFVGTLSQAPRLSGKTVALIDVSGSMYHGRVSAKSDMTRIHAACALAAILREVCEVPAIYATAGNDGTRIHQTAPIPARRGMALVDAIHAMCRSPGRRRDLPRPVHGVGARPGEDRESGYRLHRRAGLLHGVPRAAGRLQAVGRPELPDQRGDVQARHRLRAVGPRRRLLREDRRLRPGLRGSGSDRTAGSFGTSPFFPSDRRQRMPTTDTRTTIIPGVGPLFDDDEFPQSRRRSSARPQAVRPSAIPPPARPLPANPREWNPAEVRRQVVTFVNRYLAGDYERPETAARPEHLFGLRESPKAQSIITKLTPELALRILHFNRRNRDIHIKALVTYVTKQLAGKWTLTSSDMSFLKNGDLGNGQHRDFVPIITGIPIDEIGIKFGLPDDSVFQEDRGERRTLADDLTIAGYAPEFNANQRTVLSAAGRLVYHLEQGRMPWATTPSLDEEDLVALLERHPDLKEVVGRYYVAITGSGIGSASGCAFAGLFAEADPIRALEFIEKFAHGNDPNPRSPILRARDFCLKEGKRGRTATRNNSMVIVVRAWENHYHRRNVKSLSTKLFAKGERVGLEGKEATRRGLFPRVAGLRYDNHNRLIPRSHPVSRLASLP